MGVMLMNAQVFHKISIGGKGHGLRPHRHRRVTRVTTVENNTRGDTLHWER